MQPSRDIERLLEILKALRQPGSGCPWDLAQNFLSIAPYTLEEAYEVVDAIERNDPDDLKEELGDLLLQVVFHCEIARGENKFTFSDVVEAITTKMIRRHPHVFGDSRDLTPEEIKNQWAKIKSQEQAAKKKPQNQPFLADVPVPLPGLTRAVKLQSKASKVGFDWHDPKFVLAKIREETDEIEAALQTKDNAAIAEEIGDLLFTVANLARHLNADPEAAIRSCNSKFERRFGHIEAVLKSQGRSLAEASLSEMETLWQEAKALEK